MWQMIRQTSAPVLLMTVLLFFGVGYSLYKAATALSVEVDSPAYDRTPSDSIVSPELETVIPQNDPNALRSDQGGLRLPDEALFRISAGSLQIAQALQGGRLNEQTLRSAGYNLADAGKQASSLQNLYNSIFEGTDGDKEFSVEIENETASTVFAQSKAILSLLPADGAAVISMEVGLGWEPQSDGWQIGAISSLSL